MCRTWWPGSTNAGQLQLYATLIFSAVLLTICQQVAEVLGEPLERLAVEMVLSCLLPLQSCGTGW